MDGVLAADHNDLGTDLRNPAIDSTRKDRGTSRRGLCCRIKAEERGSIERNWARKVLNPIPIVSKEVAGLKGRRNPGIEERIEGRKTKINEICDKYLYYSRVPGKVKGKFCYIFSILSLSTAKTLY
jgi:hypothetical protein